MIQNFQILHQQHLITSKEDFVCLSIETLNIASYFLDCFYLNNSLIKKNDINFDALENIPIKNTICLCFTMVMKKNLEDMEEKVSSFGKNLGQHCKLANVPFAKGIFSREFLWYLAHYHRINETISISRSLRFFEIHDGRIKICENYVEFFETLISFMNLEK